MTDIPIIFECQVADSWRHKFDLWRHRGDTVSFMSTIHPKYTNRDASKHNILCRIERGTRWWRFQAATIDSFDAIDSWSWKIMEFAKIWPLTCHNWVKYWPRTKNNTTNREYSARAIYWSFPRSSTTLRLETPRGGSHQPPPPPTPAKVAKHRLRARVNTRLEESKVMCGEEANSRTLHGWQASSQSRYRLHCYPEWGACACLCLYSSLYGNHCHFIHLRVTNLDHYRCVNENSACCPVIYFKQLNIGTVFFGSMTREHFVVLQPFSW